MMTLNMTPNMEARLKRHLDEIESGLQAQGLSRSERRQVCEDVESQIRDSLEDRSGERMTLADLEAILAEMDPPEAYGETAPETHPSESSQPATRPAFTRSARHSRTAYIGAVMIGLGMLLAALTLIGVQIMAPRPSLSQLPSSMVRVVGVAPDRLIIVLIYLVFPLIGSWLGVAAISQIRNSRGELCGLPLALFDALFLPLIALNTAILVPVWLMLNGFARLNLLPENADDLLMLGAVLGMLWVSWTLIRKTCRAASAPL